MTLKGFVVSCDRIFFDCGQLGDKNYIIGIDEAGRGPLAGPVIVAGVRVSRSLLENYHRYPFLEEVNDSKKLSPSKREQLFQGILLLRNEKLLQITVCNRSHEQIDQVNILQATTDAMKYVTQRLFKPNDLLLIDGKALKGLGFEHQAIIKGDGKSCCIGMASIVAKVIRDRIMTFYHKKYALYNFAQHKGYGTAAHIATIKKYGLSPIHRKTFCKHCTTF